MSLNFNFAKIANFENLCYKIRKDDKAKVMNPVTDALLWMTMIVDLGSISEKNIEEWKFRLAFARKHFGVLSFNKVTQHAVSPFEIRPVDLTDHIGLSTNVITKTRKQWLKKITDKMVRDLDVEEMMWVDSLYIESRKENYIDPVHSV